MSESKPTGQTLTTESPHGGEDSALVLVLLAGDEPGRRFQVGAHTLILGRDPTCDVPIDDKRVSRQHARIEPEPDGSLLLVDNGSSNGVLVNGERIEQRHLNIGDRVGLGRGVVLLLTRAGRFDEQLLQAQKLQALGHLAGRLAHDFNNILTAILTNVSFLENARETSGDLTSSDVADAISDIELAARSGAELTEGLLSFAHKRDPVRDTVNVRTALAEAERLIRHAMGTGVEMHFICTEELFIFGHQPNLVNALLNLALNANDAMPEGGRLTVRAFSESLVEDQASAEWMVPGSYVVIVVEDNGLGMDEATKHRIFEPFFTTKGEAGTGMGLATVYGTVREHGGHIRVNSKEGVGTLFRIDIPAADS